MSELEPGWLMRTVHDAHMRCMLDHSPSFMARYSKIKTPISDTEADELFALMNVRFKAWTGRELAAPPVDAAGEVRAPRVATEAMITAGDNSAYACSEGINLSRLIERDGIATVYAAMIDAALQPTKAE